MFVCPKCKSDPFLFKNDCCPYIFKNIINYNKKFSYEEEFPQHSAGKYKRTNNGAPKNRVLTQYHNLLNRVKIKEGVFLDYGCCYGHGSYAVKKYSNKITYVGVDQVQPFIINGSKIYPEADYYYRIGIKEENCLRYIEDGSVDIICVSRLTDWSNFKDFFEEFNRILKSGGWLFFYGNSGGPNIKRKKFAFNFIMDNFRTDKEVLSNGLWGGKRSYLKKNESFTKKEIKHPTRFLVQKK